MSREQRLGCQTGLSMQGNQPGSVLIDAALAHMSLIWPGLRTVNAANLHIDGGRA